MENLSIAPPEWPELPGEYCDGLVGAKFGEVAISTPNAQVIYRPLLDRPASVVLNDDFRFGFHDPIAHPQPFHSSSSYLAVMIAPTQNGLDQLLFLPLSKSDWTPASEDKGLTGTGSLNGDAPGMLIAHGKQLLRKFREAVTVAAENPHGSVNPARLENEKTQRDIWYLKMYHRLLLRPASFDECHLRWVNVQRLHLNLQAYLDYVTIFHPRLLAPPSKPHPVDNARSGCLTKSMTTALDCYYAGIPVWYIYSAVAVRTERFQRYLDHSAVQALLQDTEIPSRSIQMGARNGAHGLFSLTPVQGAAILWAGQADDPARYAIMSKVLRRERSATVSAPEPSTSPSSQPFASSSSVIHAQPSFPTVVMSRGVKRSLSPSNVANPPAKKAKTKKAKTKKAKVHNNTQTNRDRWLDVRSSIMPAAIDWWMAILQEEKANLHAGDRDMPTFLGVTKEHTYYAAPDGFIFGEMNNSVTQAGILVNYARIRHLVHYWLEGVVDPKTDTKTIHPQTWRHVVGLGVLGSQKATSLAASERVAATEALKQAMSEQKGVVFDISKIRTAEARWRNGSILVDDGTLPPAKICREILWEMYELNFRSELVLLDSFVFDWGKEARRKEEDRVSPAERRMIVLSLVPYFNSSVVMDDTEFVSRGFAGSSPVERCIALVGLVTIMQGWTGLALLPVGMDQKARTLKASLSTVFADEVDEFGRSVGRHYIRTFYKVFARPPTLPRRLVPQT